MMIEKLTRYVELEAQATEIRQQMEEIKAELETAVTEDAPIAAGGFIAHMKPGRKSTDHETAVSAKLAEYSEHGMDGLFSNLQTMIDAASTTKISVKWAVVTKKAKIDTEPFTTEAPAKFVIERV